MPRQALGLLQGTVDVLILKTLSWNPLHGYGISEFIATAATAISPWRMPRSIRRCTASSAKGSSSPSGACPTRTVARASTRSRRKGASSCAAKSSSCVATSLRSSASSSRPSTAPCSPPSAFRSAPARESSRKWMRSSRRTSRWSRHDCARRGWSPTEADAEARRRFGDLELTRHYCRVEDFRREKEKSRMVVFEELRHRCDVRPARPARVAGIHTRRTRDARVRDRRQHRDLQCGARRAARAAPLLRPGSHRPRVGVEPDARRPEGHVLRAGLHRHPCAEPARAKHWRLFLRRQSHGNESHRRVGVARAPFRRARRPRLLRDPRSAHAPGPHHLGRRAHTGARPRGGARLRALEAALRRQRDDHRPRRSRSMASRSP